ncbi:hypothetical protein NEMIN01_0414 [Nematocida minor]|uniref:uncharacterized protein n=1 Tax=Nematocida minor TaxID=1912983 RepID=UPI00221E90A4|nr:uncharacterized protein NEMIN01_0414 [Nematocida minor]KAI5189248.1 hypothetical protein NEMIN01_0414 [Nematocida minor]
MAGLCLVLISERTSVYSFIDGILTDPNDSILLIDFECEYNISNNRSIDVLHTETIAEDYPQNIIVVNRINSLVHSPVEMQIRLNILSELVYNDKTVYMITSYKYSHTQKVVPYMKYIERMVDIKSTISA